MKINTKQIEIAGRFIIAFPVMIRAKWFERYYKMADGREAKLYHNELHSCESAKHGALYEVQLSLIILLKPELCPSNTSNSQ